MITEYNVTQPYFVIFSTRRARALCTQCATVLAPAQLPILTREAPPVVDVAWDNLYTPQTRKRLWSIFGQGVTIAFFLAWHIPVQYVQTAPAAAIRAACSDQTYAKLEPYLGQEGGSTGGLVRPQPECPVVPRLPPQ